MPPSRVRYAGGTVRLAPGDWDLEGQAESFVVAPFELDATEVTHLRFAECSRAGACGARPWGEPGVPVTRVNVEEAQRFCAWAGGRLPRFREFLFAATGSGSRRFAWGPTGLVCRRVSFGRVDGPCAVGARGPEIAGSRPDGRSPEGVFDLAGNVAEWTLEPDAGVAARGGSFRSKVASELKAWAVRHVREPADDIGFRCAYDG